MSRSLVSSQDGKDKAGPDNAAEKHAINEFKRSGAFDRIRKDTLKEFEASEDGLKFLANLKKIVSDEVERDTTLLARDRGKAATLVGGTVERSQLYPDARLAASKKIFQSEAFKSRLYESLKQYFPAAEKTRDEEDKKGKDENSNTNSPQRLTAQEAAMNFIQRENGT